MLYIRGRNLFLWGRFEARADEAGISHSDAVAEAIELWLGVHGEPEKLPLFTGTSTVGPEETK